MCAHGTGTGRLALLLAGLLMAAQRTVQMLVCKGRGLSRKTQGTCIGIRMVCVVAVAAVGVVAGMSTEDSTPYQPEEAAMATPVSR